MKKLYVPKNFSDGRLKMIETIDKILTSYQRQRLVLSVRQLYYQLVSKALIENSEKSYKNIVGLVTDGRLAGLLDWDMIEDRGRETITPSMYRDPAHFIDMMQYYFGIDRWADQEKHVEVMVEKAALEGVLIPVCMSEGVRFSANRGYSSASAMKEIGDRLKKMAREGKEIHILYLGDHDPSGIDMTRDVYDRLSLFSGAEVEVGRLALNRDQIDDLNPPENPAKLTDSRATEYIRIHGMSSWELDAVEPAQLAQMVRDAITDLRDPDLWTMANAKQGRMKRDLQRFVDTYESEEEEEYKEENDEEDDDE